MGLAHDGRVRRTLRQRRTQFSRRRQICHPPSDFGMGPSVCRQEDGLKWKRKFSHLRGGGGHRAPEPQDVQSEARVGPKTVPETPIRDVVDRCRIWEIHAEVMRYVRNGHDDV